ncbi:MAG: toll/interleukin-1 receptor domain-containing protein [Bacteroidales bacterium]
MKNWLNALLQSYQFCKRKNCKSLRMKDFCLIYQKENKALIKKLVSKLESEGFSCWVSPRDFKQEEKESLGTAITDSKAMVLIIDRNSASGKELIQSLMIGLENKVNIIPFVLEKIENNLYTENFFYAYNWIAAYESSFEEAYDLLKETYQDLTGEKKPVKKAVVKNKNNKNEKLSMPVLIGIGAIIFILIAYFTYNALSGNQESKIFVGKWAITDYHDNLIRNHNDSILTIQNIEGIKKNASLVFNSDNTFERRGFKNEPEIGKWKFDPDKNFLFLEPNGMNRRDTLNIENLSENNFTMVVNEVVNNNNVTTKITFTKTQ